MPCAALARTIATSSCVSLNWRRVASQMPIEDWIQHWKVARFLYDWQTLIAGALAVLAAGGGTIWATIKSASREIAASQPQTGVAQKQIETTVRLERRRAAREGFAFHAMVSAAMERVLVVTA